MSQFDKTTKSKADTYSWKFLVSIPHQRDDLRKTYEQGRNSAKESLEILARAVLESPCARNEFQLAGKTIESSHSHGCRKCEAITAVKVHGNWPLEE